MSTQSSVAWTSIHLIALLHRDIGLSSAQCFELAEALNVTPNELDRKMGDAVRVFEELAGGELQRGGVDFWQGSTGKQEKTAVRGKPPKRVRPGKAQKEGSRSMKALRPQQSVTLPFLASPFNPQEVQANRVYDPQKVDPGNEAFYLALPRINALSSPALSRLEAVDDTPRTRSLYVLKVMRFGLYDPRINRVFASRRSQVLKVLNNKQASDIQGVPLPPYSPGTFPPRNPTPGPLWYGLPEDIRKEVFSKDGERGCNAYKEYLLLRMAYGYPGSTSASLAGLDRKQVKALYRRLGLR